MEISKTERYVHLDFQIDTNRINSRKKLPNMNQLTKWSQDEVIQMEMPGVAHEECHAGNNSRRAEEANQYIYSLPSARGPREVVLFPRIAKLLFPDGVKNQNQRNDVAIVLDAFKQGCILITADGDILRHKQELGDMGVQVMDDEAAVRLVRQRIAERDEQARLENKILHMPLPDWVGID